MKRFLLFPLFIITLLACCEPLGINICRAQTTEKIIIAGGGGIKKGVLKEIIAMTHQEHPRICFIPTASADSKESIDKWGKTCSELGLDTLVLKVWCSSNEENESFEDIILHSHAILVGGGNTLNMMGIWKAQGIDTLLVKAYHKGIILAGGSAGAICWFNNGISDSRPTALSSVDGLGILPYSICPHHDNATRPALHHLFMTKGEMGEGFAMDGGASIIFRNGEAVDFISTKEGHTSYKVTIGKDKRAKEIPFTSRFLK